MGHVRPLAKFHYHLDVLNKAHAEHARGSTRFNCDVWSSNFLHDESLSSTGYVRPEIAVNGDGVVRSDCPTGSFRASRRRRKSSILDHSPLAHWRGQLLERLD